MPPRLPFWREREQKPKPRPAVLELFVLEGKDSGRQFTLEGGELAIGRGSPESGRVGAIVLAESTVSSHQATIRVSDDGATLEHRSGATNPTLVNGNPVQTHSIGPGDVIQMGSAVLEVRAREGISLSNLAATTTESRHTQIYQPAVETMEVSRPSPAEMTEVRRVGRSWGRLTVVRGPADLEGKSFELGADKTSIGRNPSSDIVIPEPGVSRNHAELVWDVDRLLLRHVSHTNQTLVNGLPVESNEQMHGGEEIQLADLVLLRLELDRAEGYPRSEPPAPVEPGLKTMVEDKFRRDQQIEREFGVAGSFLDIDVVDSYGLKAGATRPEYIILSFERFREFARGVIEEFDGQLLNSNGDELMCFFESPHQAVRSASALLVRLDEFNAKENLLGGPFRVRQGVHTGECLVDRRRGIAYSDVLDVAGHLQKHAEPNGLLISQATLDAIPPGLPFEPEGTLPREGIPTHRLAAPLD